MKYLLDTDIIIYWLKGNVKIEKKSMSVKLKNIGFSIISKAELCFGAYNSSHVAKNTDNIRILSKKISVLSFDEAASEIFGRIKSDLKKSGKIILDADIMIASTALANNLILVTNNSKHFERIKGLKIENWS